MSLIAKERSEYIPIPEDQHRAVCSAIVSIGLQECFGAVKPQLVMRFEFPDLRVEREENGQKINEPRTKWQFYTLSLNNKANLRQDMESWRGKGFTKEELEGFDVMTVLGHACQIQIIHDHSGDRIRDKIKSVSELPGDGEKPLPELEIIRYSDGEIDQWDLLPDWIKEKIRNRVIVETPPPTQNPPPTQESVEDDEYADVSY